MKKLLCIGGGLALALSIYAQDTVGMRRPEPTGPQQYCADVHEGKTVITVNGKPLRKDVIFPNGCKLSTSGMILRKDGSTATLKNGECIDKNSDIINQKSKPEGRKTSGDSPVNQK
jgi:hypothetical protein